MNLIPTCLLIITGLCSTVFPSTTLENAEMLTAAARGPLNIAALYQEARNNPSARAYKIAAELTRITNDVISMKTHKNPANIPYYQAQQAARIMQSSISILDCLLQNPQEEHNIHILIEIAADMLYTSESLWAMLSSMVNDAVLPDNNDLIRGDIGTEWFISDSQFIADALRALGKGDVIQGISNGAGLCAAFKIMLTQAQPFLD